MKRVLRTIQLKFSIAKFFHTQFKNTQIILSSLQIPYISEQKYNLKEDHGRKWLLNKTVMKKWV